MLRIQQQILPNEAANEGSISNANEAAQVQDPASSEGSISNANEAAKFSYTYDPVPMPPNWYQDPLFQDSQDPHDGYYYDVEDLNID